MPLTLTHERPKPWPENPKTLGEHLLKRRKEAGKKQVEVAQELAIDEATYLHWEKDQTAPGAEHFPKIFGFLGYDPLPPPTTLGQQIARQRLRLGLSLDVAAASIGVDSGSMSRWERDLQHPKYRMEAVQRFLGQGVLPFKLD